MRQFKARDGQTYTVEISIGTARRVRALIDFDLLGLIDAPDQIQRLADDPIFLVDLLYSIVEPQATARGIDDIAFGESLDGDAVETATRALLEALVDFFPKPRRKLLERLLHGADKVQADAMATIDKALADGTVDRIVEASIRAHLPTTGPTSGGSPGSPASIVSP